MTRDSESGRTTVSDRRSLGAMRTDAVAEIHISRVEPTHILQEEGIGNPMWWGRAVGPTTPSSSLKSFVAAMAYGVGVEIPPQIVGGSDQ